MQRPWGRTGPGVWEEQQGGPINPSRVSEGERRGEEGRDGMMQFKQGLGGPGEDMGFYPREVGALEGCGQRKDRT